MSQAWILALLFLALAAPAAGTTIDTDPRPVLWASAETFVAVVGPKELGLYQLRDAALLRTFDAKSWITCFGVDCERQRLMIGCNDGTVSMWNLATGECLWKSGLSGMLGFVYDVSFAAGGGGCVAGGYSGRAIVQDCQSGEVQGNVGFGSTENHVMSAALSPDSTQGVFIDLLERIVLFDVATSRLTRTGVTGAWPIRFSADGKYFACRSSNSGSAEQLRVVDATSLKFTDHGQYSHIGMIKPGGESRFLISAYQVDHDKHETDSVGVLITPGESAVQELWRRSATGANYRTDFGIERLIGVSTDYRLVTHVTDLRTGNPLAAIDNSQNYRPTILSYTNQGFGVKLIIELAIIILALIALVYWWKRRKRAVIEATKKPAAD